MQQNLVKQLRKKKNFQNKVVKKKMLVHLSPSIRKANQIRMLMMMARVRLAKSTPWWIMISWPKCMLSIWICILWHTFRRMDICLHIWCRQLCHLWVFIHTLDLVDYQCMAILSQLHIESDITILLLTSSSTCQLPLITSSIKLLRSNFWEILHLKEQLSQKIEGAP